MVSKAEGYIDQFERAASQLMSISPNPIRGIQLGIILLVNVAKRHGFDHKSKLADMLSKIVIGNFEEID